jgi:hypothetical protein
MASRIVVRDTSRNAPALLVIGRAGKQVRINEFDLTIEQAMLFVGDLLETIKAAALTEVENVIYPAKRQENSASLTLPGVMRQLLPRQERQCHQVVQCMGSEGGLNSIQCACGESTGLRHQPCN